MVYHPNRFVNSLKIKPRLNVVKFTVVKIETPCYHYYGTTYHNVEHGGGIKIITETKIMNGV